MFTGTTLITPEGTAEVRVLSDGEPLELHQHPAGGRVYLAGVPGRAYTLSVVNLTGRRIEVLTAVDGRNTLKDEPADKRSSSGHVLRPGEGYVFTGWRVSDAETYPFIFGGPASSVAAQATGTTRGIGVIGFAVYQEHIPPADPMSYLRSSNMGSSTYGAAAASAAPVAMASPGPSRSMEPGLGTGIGDTPTAAPVSRTQFRRLPGPPDILAIGYDTAAALTARGILGPAEPPAFPGEATGYEKYVTR